jgi:hypothetical protein
VSGPSSASIGSAMRRSTPGIEVPRLVQQASRLHESLADIPSAAFEPLHQDAAGASLRSPYGLAALPPATKLTTS